jgi:hypothetical protein
MLTPEDEKGLPYVGRIENLYELEQKAYIVTCWFYHPEETKQGRRKTDSTAPPSFLTSQGEQEIFVSHSRAENLLSVVNGKCLVLNYYQYHNEDLELLSGRLNIPKKYIFFAEFKYDDQIDEYKVNIFY